MSSQYRLHSHPNLQTSPVPPSHSHTVGDAGNPHMIDDEDNDICPVCDGECTCANSISATTSAQPIASTSTATPKLPSLKIRLTIPPNMLGKQPKSNNVGPTMSASVADGGIPRPFPQYPVPKKRGRPPKRKLGVAKANVDALSFYHSSQAIRRRNPTAPKKSATARISAKLKGKATAINKKRKRVVESSESSSELSDVDDHYPFNGDDARSIQFPTFVSASAMSSSSESDSVSLSGFDSDSSMEAEEERFIIADESRADKSRVRRELFGDDGQKRRNHNNNWVIRPRKRSVGPSDAEMDVDTDATEDEEEEEEEQGAEEDDDETDDLRVGAGYIGLATGWSEPEDDEESSFDADLFFANLTDNSDSSDDDHSYENDDRAVDGDQSDLDTMSLSDTALAGLIPRLRRDLEMLPFELTEGWDGQVIFSNGLGEARGLLDVDFEVNSTFVETSTSPSQDSDDEEMGTDELDGGDTTDEELVGEDQLPNERAMRLFSQPFSVSSINPLSTMSPGPAPRNRQPVDFPKPADILSGRVFVEDSEEYFDQDIKAPSVSCKGNGPRTGSFIPGDTVRAVIDDKHEPLPSPHPRVKGRGRGKTASHLDRTSPKYSLPARNLSLPPPSQPSFQLLSSSEVPTSPELPPSHAIDLDDVLDSAFLDCEPSDDSTTSPTEQSRKHLNLSRWGWGSDTPGHAADFGNVMRNSPLSSMMWQEKEHRARDGDRTPTPGHQAPHDGKRKAKQKNMGLGYERPVHQQHYSRQHHPNLKTRGSSSTQRSNFFNSSPPNTNL
ncbi:hypothetical protein FB45DRAFT_925690 [Roridomyces roridus]|uniref:Uncharacterized protein n=1 Tax=Roridomyces roridus TaxID=1738132 RepID=A0AAD7BJX7_9AGAR|nr:hypothetical protein FB45DRAFT_925690 [Roridomyces roridus]